MSRLDRKVRRLQRRNSQSHAFFLFFVLIVAFAAAIAARYYALNPVQITDSSMSPQFKKRSIVWVCKLPQCASAVKESDYVLVRLHSDEYMFRKILAMPGDSLSISDKGQVVTQHRNFDWKGEDAFIQSHSIYVPKIGDTLKFDNLNDVEQDYLISYLRSQGENVFVKTSLWQGDREINIDRVGATKIANRQVSLKEVDFLPWQDRYLIELQIRQSEPGNSPIKLKRKLFRKKIKEQIISTAAPDAAQDSIDISLSLPGDTTLTGQDSLEDTTSQKAEEPPAPEEISEPLNEVVITKDCFYLACEKGSSCPDSRELGYFTADRIVGLHLKTPDKIKRKFITPATSFAMTYVRGAYVIARDLWHQIRNSFQEAYDFAVETFSSKEKDEEQEAQSEDHK